MNDLKNINIAEYDLNNINNFYSNISTNFKSSINLNQKFKKNIEDAYARTLLNFGKSALSMFHLKYIIMFEELAEYYEDDEELIEFSNSMISVINNYFEDLDSNLNIKTKHDLENLNYILNISLFLLEEAINDKNIDLAYESFFQIERKINAKKLYEKLNKDFSIKFTIKIDQHTNNSNTSTSNINIKNFNNGEAVHEI